MNEGVGLSDATGGAGFRVERISMPVTLYWYSRFTSKKSFRYKRKISLADVRRVEGIGNRLCAVYECDNVCENVHPISRLVIITDWISQNLFANHQILFKRLIAIMIWMHFFHYFYAACIFPVYAVITYCIHASAQLQTAVPIGLCAVAAIINAVTMFFAFAVISRVHESNKIVSSDDKYKLDMNGQVWSCPSYSFDNDWRLIRYTAPDIMAFEKAFYTQTGKKGILKRLGVNGTYCYKSPETLALVVIGVPVQVTLIAIAAVLYAGYGAGTTILTRADKIVAVFTIVSAAASMLLPISAGFLLWDHLNVWKRSTSKLYKTCQGEFEFYVKEDEPVEQESGVETLPEEGRDESENQSEYGEHDSGFDLPSGKIDAEYAVGLSATTSQASGHC